MKKIKIKNNNKNVIKTQNITLINERGETYTFNKRTKLKTILEKVINGFDKIYLITTKEGKKILRDIKCLNGLLIGKFREDRKTYIIDSEKLEELTSIFLITNFKFKVRENYEISNDIVEFNKEKYELLGFMLNNNYINKDNLNEIEELIFNYILYENFKIKSLFLRNIKNNKLIILDVKKILIDTIRKEIRISIKKRKTIIKEIISEDTIILETIFKISSIKVNFEFDA